MSTFSMSTQKRAYFQRGRDTKYMKNHECLMRGLDYVGKKIETARQVSMNARSEFEKEKKALQVVLENKEQSVRQVTFLSLMILRIFFFKVEIL